MRTTLCIATLLFALPAFAADSQAPTRRSAANDYDGDWEEKGKEGGGATPVDSRRWAATSDA